jgi:hypothetical protein
MLTRRDFIKIVGIMGGLILTPIGKLMRLISPHSDTEIFADGEMYEGFLLLELDASLPSFVELAPCPILGEIKPIDEKNNPDASNNRGESLWFDSLDELIRNSNFPIFTLASLPDKVVFLKGSIIKFAKSAQIWEIRMDFGYEHDGEPLVNLWASPIFSRPYPVWPDIVYSEKDLNQPISDEQYYIQRPEKINFTPTPGILKAIDQGYMLQWIKNDVLYTLTTTHEEWRDKPELVVNLLVQK